MKVKLSSERPIIGAAAPKHVLWQQSKIRNAFALLCLAALLLSVHGSWMRVRRDLNRACSDVADDFGDIMAAYVHSFELMEKYLQLEIETAGEPDAIEAFLKETDGELLAIEGGDYDGVYMYYHGRYLYSWDTPLAVYEDSGYDATQRPWYIGAAKAGGQVFFSVPYPSYANDYMLATISRLQPDGETVIAYDIKLGEIEAYVDKLDIYDGSLTLICDDDGNILGSTNRLYQGGNYRLTAEQLERGEAAAREALASAADENAERKAQRQLRSAEAQSDFLAKNRGRLETLLQRERTLCLSLRDFTLGYAYSSGGYACFVLLPLSHCLLSVVILWAALSFFLTLAMICIVRMLSRSSQIVTDALTGLNNRRALLKYCNDHIAHHPEDELCLVMLDLNNFKQINDQYGHVVGDQALLDAADALKKTCAEAPRGFFLCRYGGNEFLLAGSNCSRADVGETLALVRRELRSKNAGGSEPYTLEISCGVARGKGVDIKNIESLLAQADSAMYRDKTRMKLEREGVQ